MVATTHKLAAVVKPVTTPLSLRKIVPAPKNPIPLITCATNLSE